ncbi:hypothetical protein BDR04DRAFT_1120173 [Suillus decipiens]|nr:hypothetical protein BDR04DRAFT_1120173 [Suillus decipiens]
MPKYTISSHTSPCFGLSSFEDECAESDATNSAIDPEDGYTLTSFGEVSFNQGILRFAPNDIRRRNRLRLKKRHKSAQHSLQISNPTEKFWDPLTSSPISTPLSPTEFFNRFRHSVRRAFQLAQAQAAEAEARSRAADSGESTSSNSSTSCDYEPQQPVIAKVDPALVKERRKLPSRPAIPKWDVDN